MVLIAAVVLGTLVVPGLPAAAQADPAGGGSVTLDVKDRPLKDVVEFIRGKTAVNIVVAPDAEAQKVTINIRDLPWEKALELIAERAECVIVQDGPNLVRVEKPPQVSFEFEDADVRKVISVIAAYSGANIVVGQEVQGTVTIRLNRVPWRSALDTVVKSLGFIVVEDERQILRVTDPARLQEQLETRVFTFRFVRPPAPYLAHIKTDVQLDSVKAPGMDTEKEFNILKAFRASVAPEGTLEYIASSNSIVVTGTAPKLDRLEELMQKVDTEPSMVGVDIQFVLTRNRDFLDVGVDPGDEGFNVAMSFGQMTHRLPFSLGDGGWEDSISAEGNPTQDGDWRGTGPSGLAPGTGFSFGTLDFTGVQFTLRLLKQDVSSRLVQAPKILTLDNQAATIFVGETIRYAQTTAEQGQAGGLQYSIEEAENSPVQTGFQMLVIPHVIPGTQKIMMTVIPQQKTLTGTSAEQPGFNVFRGGSGSSEVQIALPQEAAATVVTHMLLESGETAVIGGLLTDQESKQINAIPFVSELPIIGWLFKNEQTSETKEHLIILITPRILRGAEERRASLSSQMRDVLDRVREEYKELSGEAEERSLPAKPADADR
jgi:type IV pilus assembly protein PilQ